MRSHHGVLAMTLLAAAQGTPLDGSWMLTRMFRSGPLSALAGVTPP